MRRPHRYMLSCGLAAIATSLGRIVAPAIAAMATTLPAWPVASPMVSRRRRNRTAPLRPTGIAAARRAARKRRSRK